MWHSITACFSKKKKKLGHLQFLATKSLVHTCVQDMMELNALKISLVLFSAPQLGVRRTDVKYFSISMSCTPIES